MRAQKASAKHPKESHPSHPAADFRPSSASEPAMKRNSFFEHPIARLRGAVLGSKEHPTGFAMKVQSIGGSMPKTVAAANRLGEKGRALLEKFINSRSPSRATSASPSKSKKRSPKRKSAQH